MKNKLLGLLLCCVLFLGLTGCNEHDLSENDIIENDVKENFIIRHTLTDGRYINFTFGVSYGDGYLHEALEHDEITIDEFIDKLDFASAEKDCGSNLYKYNSDDKIFGNDDFYTLVCNSYMGIKDIFVAKNIGSLTNKCVTDTDELNKVNNKIIEYFTTNGVKDYENFCGNYVDEITGVVVVKMLDISKEEQDKFQRLVVNSDLIEFRKSEKGINDLK